jgi:ElaB/YqjD/DUF883 family membrane-anchored ribosome-binding protein
MERNRTNVVEEAHANSSSTETLKNKAQETAVEVRDRAKKTRDQIREHAEALSGQAKEMTSEYYQHGLEKAAEWEGVLENQIREKPIPSLLIAGGIGLLLGLLWRR